MGRVFLLLFVFSLSLYAGDKYPFYVWGDINPIYNAFSAIAMVFQDSDFKEKLSYIAGLVSILTVGKWLVQENFKMAFAEVAYVLGIIGVVYGTSTTVHIVDKRTGINDINATTSGYRDVSHIPAPLSLTTYTASVFVDYVVNTIDDVASPIPTQSYVSQGFLTNLEFLKEALLIPEKTPNSSPELRGLSNYYSKCIMKNVLDISQSKFAELSNPSGYIGDVIKPSYLGIGSKQYNDTISCQDYYDHGASDDDNIPISTALANIGADAKNNDFNSTHIKNTSAAEDDMMKIMDPLGKLSTMDKAFSQLIAASVYDKTAAKQGIGVSGIDTANGVSATASKLQLLQNGSGQFSWMADMLPKAMHLLTIIILLAYIPMGIVMAALGMQKGLKVLVNFSFGFVAYQSIHIAFAITQNVVNWYTANDAANKLLGYGIVSPLNSVSIPSYVQYLSDMTGLAGLLGVAAIPVVVGIMYKGEVMAASGVAMGIGGAYKSLGAQGAMGAMEDNFGKNLAEDNEKSRRSEEERKARLSLANFGEAVPANGSAIEALARYQDQIEKANKNSAAFSAITSEGGATALNAGAGAKSSLDQQSKMDYGKKIVEVGGGELDNINLAKTVGGAMGANQAGQMIGQGKSMREEANEAHSSVDSLAFAAGASEGIKSGSSMMGAGVEAINSGIVSKDGNVNIDDKRKERAQAQKELDSLEDELSGMRLDPDTNVKTFKKAQEHLKDKIQKQKDKIANLDKLQSGNDFATAAFVEGEQGVASQLQKGKEFNSTEDGVKNAIHASKLKAIQDAQTEMATGKFGNDADFRQVAAQNAEISAKTINNTAKRRNELDGSLDADGNPTEKWSADKIAEGQAISSVQGEIKQQGVYNALEKEKNTQKENDDSKSFRRAAMGNEFSGRKEENDLLGIGKKWGEETKEKRDVKIMAEEQENAAVSAIGSIQAVNAEIQKHRRHGKDAVDGAINDMITAGDEKGTASATHAEKMRDEFKGPHLTGKSTTTGNTLQKEYEKAKKDYDGATEALSELDSNKDLSGEEKDKQTQSLVAKQREAKSRMDSAKKLSDAFGDGMSLKDVDSNIEQSKIQSMVGQAAGIKANVDKNPAMYAQNAMYSEESKQQSTDKKISTQGGVDKAVTSDVAEAGLKAAKQQKVTEAEIQQQAFDMLKKDNPKASKEELNKASENIAKAIMSGGSAMASNLKSVIGDSKIKVDGSMKVSDMAQKINASAGNLAGTLVGGKTASDLATVSTHGSSDDYIQAQKRIAIEKATHSSLASKFADNQVAKEKQIAEERKQEKWAGKEAEYIADGQKYGFLDKNGNAVKDGDAWVKGRAAMTAASMSRHEQGFIAGGRINTITNPITGDSITNIDGKRVVSSGLKADASVDDKLFKDQNEAQKTQEVLEHTDLRNELARQVASGGTTATISSLYQKMGMNKDTADKAAVYTEATGVVLGVAEVGGVLKNFKDGKPTIHKQDTNGNKLYKDKESKKEVKQDKEGNYFTEEADGTKKEWTGNEDNLKAQKRLKGGPVSEGVRNGFNSVRTGGENLRDFLSRKEEPNQSTQNHSDGQQQTKPNEPNKTEPNQSVHGDTSSNEFKKETNPFSKDSVPNKKDTVKDILEKRKALEAMPDKDAGRLKLASLVDEKLKTVEPGSSEEKALRQVKTELKGNGSVDVGQLRKAGLSTNDLESNGVYTKSVEGKNGKSFKVVDFENTGDFAKADKVMELDDTVQREKAKEKMHKTAMTNAEEKLKFSKPTPELKPSGTVLDVPHPNIPTSTGATGDIVKVAEDIHGGGKFGSVLKAGAVIAGVGMGTSAFANDNGNVVGTAGKVASTLFNQDEKNTVTQNALNAVDSTVSMLDPSIAGYQTVKQTVSNVKTDISQGKYGKAAEDIASTPVNFAKNIIDDGLSAGKSLHKMYDQYENSSSVTDSMPKAKPSSNETPSQKPSDLETGPIKSNGITSQVDPNGVVGFNQGATGATTQATIDTGVISQAVASAISNTPLNTNGGTSSQSVGGNSNGGYGSYPSMQNGDNNSNIVSQMTSGSGSMGGGHVGAMMAEGKMNQESSSAKTGKILTELASNSYMGDMDIIDELRSFNKNIDNINNMKGGRD